MNGFVLYDNLQFFGFNIVKKEEKHMNGTTTHVSFDTILNGQVVHKEIISPSIAIEQR